MILKLRICLGILSLFFTLNSFSQTTLSPGDAALTGFITDNPDQFVFVLLKDVELGTQIHFTDRGWNSTTGTFRAGEGTLTWTATSNLNAGTVVDVLDANNPFNASIGTITDDNNFQLSASGDQILVYQGTDFAPTFINAITFDSSGWLEATTTATTALPPGLTNYINAIDFAEIDNGSFVCPSNPVNGTPGTILTEIMTLSNWELNNSSLSTSPLGGGCTFNVTDPCTDPAGTDSDGDGVNDLCDLDDDNDGIPDAIELGTLVSTEQQPCGGDTSLDFSGTQTLLSGTDLQQDAVYRFSNITATMDAIVTIVETNNATVTELDRNVTTPASFKPRTGFNFTNAGEFGYIEYLIQFVNTGGTTAQTIPKFFMNFNDLDGGTNFGEQNWADNPSTYTIDNPTEVTMNTDGTWIVATGATSDYGPSTNEFPFINFAVNYTNKSEITIRVGAVARVPGVSSAGRSHSIEFNCITNYVAPETYSLDGDFDGLANHLDLDSDNDGILDADESGHGQTHTNGILAGPYGTNGLADVVETSPGSDAINYTLTDTDGVDGSNFLDADSDADGCYDALEGTAIYDYSDININTGQLLAAIDVDGVPGGTSQGVGTSTNATIQADACIDGAAIDFDGIDDYLEIPAFMNGWNTTSIMGWIKIDESYTPTAPFNRVFGQTPFNIHIGSTLKARAGLYTGTSSTHYQIESSFVLEKELWYHLAAVYDGTVGAFRMYINGEKLPGSFETGIPNTGISIHPTYGQGDFTMGRDLRNSSWIFKGAIDEVRVFDVALTEDQIQRMVYQEIVQNGLNVKGTAIDKDIIDIVSNATIPWVNLQAYYPMTNILSGKTTDASIYSRDAELKNITTVQPQTAPLPYETVGDGDWTEESTWLYGNVWDIENLPVNIKWSIVQIHDNVTTSNSHTQLGLFIDDTKTLTVNGDNAITNSWYFELNGVLDLENDSQLIQTINSDLVTSTQGRILRRQEGNTNVFWYNYWTSPVGARNATTLSTPNNQNTTANNPNNTPFSINMLNQSNLVDVQFTTALSPPLTNPVTLSSRWFYNFQNGLDYNDWVAMDETTAMIPGMGYTQKGTGAAGLEQQYIFEGKPNNGTILIAADDVDGDAANESEEGVTMTTSLIGNPYPSALNAVKFINDNAGTIQGTILLWEQWAGNSHYLSQYQGGYGYINTMTTARAYQHPDITIADQTQTQGIKTPTFFIPVGQGFFVEVVTNLGDIEFNNSQRVFKQEALNESIFFDPISEDSDKPLTSEEVTRNNNPSNIDLIRFEFKTSAGATRHFVTGFSDITTDEFDYGFDGGLITTTPEEDMGIFVDDQHYVLQAFAPITPEKVVDLTFNASGDYTYSLEMIDIQNIDPTQDVYLKDNQENIYWNLRQGTYNFTAFAGQDHERFDLVFQSGETLSNNEFNTNDVLIYVNNNGDKLFINGMQEDAKSISITNMIGQNIKTLNNVRVNTLENGIDVAQLASGVYIVNLETEGHTQISKKVIIE